MLMAWQLGAWMKEMGMSERDDEWKPGLPPGPYYDGMIEDFEVYFSPAGAKWHRRKCKNDDAQRAALAASGEE